MIAIRRMASPLGPLAAWRSRARSRMQRFRCRIINPPGKWENPDLPRRSANERRRGAISSAAAFRVPMRCVAIGLLRRQNLRNLGNDLVDGLLVQLALLEGVVGLDLPLVIKDHGDVRVLGDVVALGTG